MPKLTACPHCGGDLEGLADGRNGDWHFRMRLYDMQVNKVEPMWGADSDPDRELDQPGAEVARGLWKAAHECIKAATEYHGGVTLRGLGAEIVELKIRGARPTISRTGGKARITIPYDTPDSFTVDGDERYQMRIDVLKVSRPRPLVVPEPSQQEQ